MAKRVQLIRQNAVLTENFLGLVGELTVNTSNNSIHVHDGANKGGTELARFDLDNSPDATVSRHGRMTAQQVLDLQNALVDILQNAADIGTETTNRIAGDSALDTAKADKIVPTTANSIALLDAGGNLAVSDKIFSSTDDVVDNFPAGTVKPFFQAAAPIGWTQVITHNDKSIRIVSGTGGGSGGSVAFSTVFALTATDGHQLTIAEMPAHTHSDPRILASGGVGLTTSGTPLTNGQTGSTGGDGLHSHNIDIRVQYIDMILASKD